MEYTKRYGVNIADAMQNAKIDRECFGPFATVEDLHKIESFRDRMRKAEDEFRKARKALPEKEGTHMLDSGGSGGRRNATGDAIPLSTILSDIHPPKEQGLDASATEVCPYCNSSYRITIYMGPPPVVICGRCDHIR